MSVSIGDWAVIQEYARDLVAEIKTHVTEEVNRIMAEVDDLNNKLEDLRVNIANELQQISAGLNQQLVATQQALSDKSAEADTLRGQLESNQTGIETAMGKVDALNSELTANDPPPTVDPMEPGPPSPTAAVEEQAAAAEKTAAKTTSKTTTKK